ncbi:hypothetical protein CEXT_778611 [Caerostris extrusa]|uniref:CUB domain-containing protein n=1 Tax=Caerostris extrusa TaxID=172846 RepID=A0AAV4V3R1_CAEEX|nr:hypothetical protein CEXT_778611 [Caerostris extrusa]
MTTINVQDEITSSKPGDKTAPLTFTSCCESKFCGDTKVPDVLISTKYRMLVTYKASANHNTYKGFKAHYEGISFQFIS